MAEKTTAEVLADFEEALLALGEICNRITDFAVGQFEDYKRRGFPSEVAYQMAAHLHSELTSFQFRLATTQQQVAVEQKAGPRPRGREGGGKYR